MFYHLTFSPCIYHVLVPLEQCSDEMTRWDFFTWVWLVNILPNKREFAREYERKETIKTFSLGTDYSSLLLEELIENKAKNALKTALEQFVQLLRHKWFNITVEATALTTLNIIFIFYYQPQPLDSIFFFFSSICSCTSFCIRNRWFNLGIVWTWKLICCHCFACCWLL